MIYRRAILLLCIVVVALGAAADATAGDGWGNGYPWGYGGYGGSIYTMDRIPYFSQHPPVYYSYPVPRTYGYSPYAYPPGVMTPDAPKAPAPLTLDNPFFPKPGKVTETNDRAAAVSRPITPLVVINPFVKSTHVVADVAK